MDPDNLEELDDLFRAVLHGTQASMYREEFHLYFFRIKNGFTMPSKGSHYADENCIGSFFKNPWSTPVPDLSEKECIHLYSSLAVNQMCLGQINSAVLYAEKSLTWLIENQKWLQAASFAGPYISMLIAVGRLLEVKKVMKVLDTYIAKTENSEIKAMSLVLHGYVDHLMGDTINSAIKFEKAETEITKPAPKDPVAFPIVSSYYCKFLVETGKKHQALNRLLKTFAWRKRKTWQVEFDTSSIYASDLLILGLTFLAIGDLINAKKHLDQQVEIFRSSDEWLYLPTGLHSRARYFIKIGDCDNAITDLNEALQIYQRTGALFGEWESYLNLAHLCRELNQTNQCAEYLQKAMVLPNMNMYRFPDGDIAELREFVASNQG